MSHLIPQTLTPTSLDEGVDGERVVQRYVKYTVICGERRNAFARSGYTPETWKQLHDSVYDQMQREPQIYPLLSEIPKTGVSDFWRKCESVCEGVPEDDRGCVVLFVG